MRKQNFILIAVAMILCALYVSSCSKRDTNPAPSIRLSAPVDGSIVKKGEKFKVTLATKDIDKIQAVSLSMKRYFDTVPFLSIYRAPGTEEFLLDTLLSVDSAKKYDILGFMPCSIIAIVSDQTGKIDTATAQFKVAKP